MAETKGIKTYSLKICYNDKTQEIEFIQEYIDGDSKNLMYGDMIISEYFDEEGLEYMDEFYEVAET